MQSFRPFPIQAKRLLCDEMSFDLFRLADRNWAAKARCFSIAHIHASYPITFVTCQANPAIFIVSIQIGTRAWSRQSCPQVLPGWRSHLASALSPLQQFYGRPGGLRRDVRGEQARGC